MHSFQNFIVRLIPNHPPPLETRIWKLVVRALVKMHPGDHFLVISINYISGKIANKQPTLYLNQDNLQFA